VRVRVKVSVRVRGLGVVNGEWGCGDLGGLEDLVDEGLAAGEFRSGGRGKMGFQAFDDGVDIAGLIALW